MTGLECLVRGTWPLEDVKIYLDAASTRLNGLNESVPCGYSLNMLSYPQLGPAMSRWFRENFEEAAFMETAR